MEKHPNDEERHLATLDELQATQEEIRSYQGLFKDLPEIFERKFNDRLTPLLERKQQLIAEREHLLHQLHQIQPTLSQPQLLLPPSPATPMEELGHLSAPEAKHLRWLLLLAALGMTLGVLLSRSLLPARQHSTPEYPPKSLRRSPPSRPDSSVAPQPMGPSVPSTSRLEG